MRSVNVGTKKSFFKISTSTLCVLIFAQVVFAVGPKDVSKEGYTERVKYIMENVVRKSEEDGACIHVSFDGMPLVQFKSGIDAGAPQLSVADIFSDQEKYQLAEALASQLLSNSFPASYGGGIEFCKLLVFKMPSKVEIKDIELDRTVRKKVQADLSETITEIGQGRIDKDGIRGILKRFGVVYHSGLSDDFYFKEKRCLAWYRAAVYLADSIIADNKKGNPSTLHALSASVTINKAKKQIKETIAFTDDEISKSTEPKDINQQSLELLCWYFGADAEDALIHKLLSEIEFLGNLPKEIEIFGDKDPCPQCQFKLQWLADEIKRKSTGSDDSPVKVCYYAEKSYGAPYCVVSTSVPLIYKYNDDRSSVVNSYETRKGGKKDSKLKVFLFESGKEWDIQAFKV